MKMKLVQNKKIFKTKIFTNGTCTPNIYPYSNAFCADCSQVLQVKNLFLCFWLRQNYLKILCKFQIFPCNIHGEIPKNLLSELCEKRKY